MNNFIVGAYDLKTMRNSCIQQAKLYDYRNVVTRDLLVSLGLLENWIMINFTGEVNEYFFDNQMLSYMIKNRCNEHIALITQDKNLMGDIILMNRMSSFTGNDVNVYTLNNKGHIITIV